MQNLNITYRPLVDDSNKSMGTSSALFVNEVYIPSEEALYFACQFPNNPEIQELIISESDTEIIKVISNKNLKKTRPDWNVVKSDIMNWCISISQMQNGGKGNITSVQPPNIDNFLLLGHPITTVYPTDWYLDD